MLSRIRGDHSQGQMYITFSLLEMGDGSLKMCVDGIRRYFGFDSGDRFSVAGEST